MPKPGDFITTRIGKHPVVLSRHADGKIYVIHNSCGHRGAIVCNEDKGNAQLFRCCYHGWTFKTNGDLDAVAMPRGYGKDFDFTNPALGMGRLPRVGIYRGFVFASLAKKARASTSIWATPRTRSTSSATAHPTARSTSAAASTNTCSAETGSCSSRTPWTCTMCRSRMN